MAFFDSRHQRAAIVLALLAIGLAIALAPYATGLIAVPVLYVILGPIHRWLCRWVKPPTAASLVVILTLLVLVIPGFVFASVLVNQAQDMAGKVVAGPLLGRLREMRVGPFDVGAELLKVGQGLVTWLGGNAVSLLGTATRLALNILFALFGLYYLLIRPDDVWHAVRPYIPFSPANTTLLRERFQAVSVSTVIGTGLTAIAQGTAVALGFAFTGLANPLFWGVVTVVFAVLPVVGSGMIWGPGVAVVAFDGRFGAAGFLLIWNLVATGIIDYVIRPVVYNRFASIHPLVTLVGAVAGVSYFGILGLLVGPLALSYFFEILRMYRQEFVHGGTDSGFTEELPSAGPPAAEAAPSG
ncbi:MAG: AI-2E family transporter [Gemmatimonadetes bacterium]|nr:AI-2E family transporter [Gemmatimonadota bacterium]